MFCSPWDCRWKAPVRLFVFRLADRRPRTKWPMPPMHSSESRSEPKTPANMPSLRQLEFAFQTTDPLTSILSLRKRRTTKSHGDGRVIASSRDVDLETEARQLLCSLGANRIAKELRIEWNSRLKTTAG